MPNISLVLLTVFPSPVGPDEFGLKPGTESVHEVRAGSERPKEQVSKVVGQTRAQGMDVFDVKLDNGRHQFFGVTPKGLFQFQVSDMAGQKLDEHSAPVPLLLLDKRTGESWEWVEPFRGQTSEGLGSKEVDWERLKTHCRATLVSDDAKVTVPAGTFTSWHVAVDRRSDELGAGRQEIWIAKGRGIVKQTSIFSEWRSESRLVRQN